VGCLPAEASAQAGAPTLQGLTSAYPPKGLVRINDFIRETAPASFCEIKDKTDSGSKEFVKIDKTKINPTDKTAGRKVFLDSTIAKNIIHCYRRIVMTAVYHEGMAYA
jgi:hypothetical protein